MQRPAHDCPKNTRRRLFRFCSALKRERVVGAAEFERARPLQVFAFEKHACVCPRVHGAGREDRRAMRVAGEDPGCIDDIGVGHGKTFAPEHPRRI